MNRSTGPQPQITREMALYKKLLNTTLYLNKYGNDPQKNTLKEFEKWEAMRESNEAQNETTKKGTNE
jgi:hypothetical protein